MSSNKNFLLHPEVKAVLHGRGSVSRAVGSAALELCGAEKPKVLLIASASMTADEYWPYINSATDIFGGQLGASVTSLHKYDRLPTQTQIEHGVGAADLIWIPGGDSQHAKKIFDKTGLGQSLIDASKTKVLGGGSAGMMLLSKQGMSYHTPVGGPNRYVDFRGLPIVNATVSPHLNFVEPEDGNTLPRSEHFERYLQAHPDHTRPAFGVDDQAAIVLNGETYRVVADEVNNGVTTYSHVDNGFDKTRLMPSNDFSSVKDITG